MRGPHRRLLIAVLAAPLTAATLSGVPLTAAPPDTPPAIPPERDPLAQIVLDSVARDARTTPESIFDALFKAWKVEAYDVAAVYLGRFVEAAAAAGDRRLDILADLGDAHDDGTLLSLERQVGPLAPDAAKVFRDIRSASRLRRRDAKRLATALEDLQHGSFSRRTQAAHRLSLARLDAIGAIVAWLNDPSHATDDDERTARSRGVVAGLLRDLGEDGLVSLIGWLGTPDVANWPGVLSAIDLADPPADRVRHLFFAPAVVVDTPPEARRRAKDALHRRDGRIPTRAEAVVELERRLDRLLCSDVPERAAHGRADLANDPPADAFKEIAFWDPNRNASGRVRLSPRQQRSLEASHLTRDLAALGGLAGSGERLILLAQLEATLLVVDRADASAGQRILAAVSTGEGPSASTVAAVLDEAIDRGMTEAAEAAATVIAETAASPDNGMEPAVRRSLLRAVSAPDLGVRFAAARALTILGPRNSYAGQSRVLDTLLDAATSTGEVRAVVADPRAARRQELAAAVASLGYAPQTVARGRDAVVAVRDDCDVRLVVLAADLGPPGGRETTEFLSHVPTDGPLNVVVVHEDDDLSRIPPVGDEDRKKASERLARAGESLRLLAIAAREGERVADSLPVAIAAAEDPRLAPPAIALLSAVGRPQAQAALHAIVTRPDAPEELRERAFAAFRRHVARFGILLETCDISGEYRRYNTAVDPATRRWSGLVLDVLESRTNGDPTTAGRSPSGDASKSR